MACAYGFSCDSIIHQCKVSVPNIGCVDGGSGCHRCAIGDFVSRIPFATDGYGKWLGNPDATHGHLLDKLGWVIDRPGKTDLQAGDIVVEINEMPASLGWFYRHAFEQGLDKDQQPTEFRLLFFRPGEMDLQTLTITRS
jgi:hypothetical protein